MHCLFLFGVTLLLLSGLPVQCEDDVLSKGANGSCLLQTQKHYRTKHKTYVWQRTISIHEGKSTAEVLQDLAFSLSENEVEELADGIDTHKPIKPQVGEIFGKVAEKKHLLSEYTMEELRNYKKRVAAAVDEDVKKVKKDLPYVTGTTPNTLLLERESLHHKPSKPEMKAMLVQELVQQQPLVTKKLVKKQNVQTATLGWKGGKNKFNRDMTLADYPTSLGYFSDEHIKEVPDFYEGIALLESKAPSEFDPTKKWPKCVGNFKHVRDQGKCGSCWAQSTVGAFNDRLCIQSGGQFTVELSAADMTACSKKNLGCRGGNPYYATKWLTANGVVSGGDFPDIGKHRSCYPYPIADKNAKNHFQSQVATPKCRTSCSESRYKVNYKQDKYYSAGDAYLIGPRFPHEHADHQKLWAQVKEELSTKGPIMVMYAATKEHLSYQSGIWDCPPGTPNHGVKCIGYGVDPTHGNYITCVNSWNVHFGEEGLFHMKFPGSGCLDMMMGMPVEWRGKNENQYKTSKPQPPRPTFSPQHVAKAMKGWNRFMNRMKSMQSWKAKNRAYTPKKRKRRGWFR